MNLRQVKKKQFRLLNLKLKFRIKTNVVNTIFVVTLFFKHKSVEACFRYTRQSNLRYKIH